MRFFHHCRHQTPQGSHLKLSKLVLLVCTAFLVHVLTVSHYKHQGSPRMGVESEFKDIDDVSGTEADSSGSVGSSHATSPSRALDTPHPLDCAAMRAVVLSLGTGVLAGLTGRSLFVMAWLIALCFSFAISLAAVGVRLIDFQCHSSTAIDCYEQQGIILWTGCSKFVQHLIAIVISVWMFSLSELLEHSEVDNNESIESRITAVILLLIVASIFRKSARFCLPHPSALSFFLSSALPNNEHFSEAVPSTRSRRPQSY